MNLGGFLIPLGAFPPPRRGRERIDSPAATSP